MTADAKAAPGPYDDFMRAGSDVLNTILERDQTHGDPEAFGATFARMLAAYLTPIVSSGRPIGPADGFIVLDLMKTARIASGGHHPDHYRDKAGYGLLGMVHVQRAFAAVQAQQAAPEPEDAPEATPEPAPAADPLAAAIDQIDAQPPELATPNLDEDDRDLLRWALDPASDPFADLIEPFGQLRPGVTQQDVENRRLRVLELVQKFQPAAPAQQEARSVALAKYGRAAA
jgi:hypothetical protein